MYQQTHFPAMVVKSGYFGLEVDTNIDDSQVHDYIFYNSVLTTC